MLEQLKERNMELLEQISQLKLKLQAFENDQLRKMFFELTTIPYFVKLAFLVILGQAFLAHLVLCWWDGWWLWREGCISQDTYLVYW